MNAPAHTVEAGAFRSVLGHFCTGVTVVTGMDGQQPAGFACQSFAALSLDPPLVLFCPARASRSWQAIGRGGRFCVNVLTAEQRDVSQVFGTGGTDKFAGLGWSSSPGGCPVLDDVLTWVDCGIADVFDGGDHRVVLGRVTELGPVRDEVPLLFYRSKYTATDPNAETRPAAWLEELLSWPRESF
ncbi:MAG: monooxygenase [Pseudonocardiaceae bacterium]|nr:monooxygenase [Pseudonocardiaceae bacterium]